MQYIQKHKRSFGAPRQSRNSFAPEGHSWQPVSHVTVLHQRVQKLPNVDNKVVEIVHKVNPPKLYTFKLIPSGPKIHIDQTISSQAER